MPTRLRASACLRRLGDRLDNKALSIPGFTAPATMELVGRMGGNQKGFSAIGECGVGIAAEPTGGFLCDGGHGFLHETDDQQSAHP